MTERLTPLLAALALLPLSVPVQAQEIDRLSSAAALRSNPDPRLRVGGPSSSWDSLVTLDSYRRVPADSARGDYRFEGMVIGGAITGLSFSLVVCGLVREWYQYPPCVIVATPFPALIGMVFGGLIGRGIKKPGPVSTESTGLLTGTLPSSSTRIGPARAEHSISAMRVPDWD